MNANYPAYPVSRAKQSFDGLTKRELCALKVLQGLCANHALNECSYEEMADIAVKQADALLAQLAKEST